MPQNEVKIVITGDSAQAVNAVKKLEGETQSLTSKIKSHWVAAAAAIAGAMVTVHKGLEYMDLGAKAQQAEESFHRVAESYHQDANKILAEMKRLTAGTINESDMMQKAVKGMVQGLSGDQIIKITEAARIAARVAGKDITTAYEDITDAIGNNLPRALIRYGLVTKAQMKLVNEAISLGIQDVNLYGVAMANAAIQSAAFGEVTLSNAEKLQQLKAAVEETRESIGIFMWEMLRDAKLLAQNFPAYIGAAIKSLYYLKTGASEKSEEAILEARKYMAIIQGTGGYVAPEFMGKTTPETDIDKAKKDLADWTDNLKKMIEAAKNKDKLDELVNAMASFREQVQSSNPLLSEQEKAIIHLEFAYNKLLESFKKIGVKPPEELAALFKEGLRNIEFTKSLKELDDYRKAVQEAGQAEIQLQKNISQVYAGELGKRMMEVDEWESQQHELAVKIARDWIDYAAIMERVDEATAKKRLDISKEYYRQVQEVAIQNQLALVDIEEKTFAISLDEATKKRIGLKQKELQYLKDQYNDLIGITGKELERLQVISKITEVQGTLTDLIARQGGFSEGVTRGINEYLRSLEYNFDRGKAMASDLARNVEDALVKMFDKPKEAIKDLGNYFIMMLKRMVAQAAASQIIIPITTVLFGGSAAQAATSAAGITTVTGGGGIFSSLISPIQSITGLLSNFGQTLLGSTSAYNTFLYGLAKAGIGVTSFAEGLGSVVPYLPLLGSALMGLQGNWGGAIGSALGFGGSLALRASLGSIVPGIGTIIGGILGSLLGGLLGGKKKLPEAGLAWHTGTEGYPGKGWSAAVEAGEGGFAEAYFKNIGLDDAAKQVAKSLIQIRETVMDTFKNLGLDISGFYKDWNYYIGDLSGKSEAEIKAAFQEAYAEYIKFASGINFSDWQKEGEKLATTIDRIISAIANFPKVLESIQDYIDAINDDYDVIAKWKEQMNDATNNIKKLEKALEEATDPADAIDYANQLKQAILETYLAAKQMVEGLVKSIKDMEEEAFRFSYSLQKTIDELTGSYESIGMVYSAANELLRQYFAATTAAEKIRILKLGIEVVNEGLAITIQHIQDSYRAQEAALNARRDSIQEETNNLQKQLQLIRAWSSVLDSVKKQISDLVTSPEYNPANYLELVGYKRQEIDKMQGLYAGATGEEKAGYASQLQTLINEYLKLGQEAYQFPSPEYMAMYQESLVWLQQIQSDAEQYAQSEEDILRQIEALETESNAINAQIASLSSQMASEISAVQAQAAEYYRWIQTEGMGLYQQVINDLKERLASIIGDKRAEEYIHDAQMAAVQELVYIRDLLTKIFSGLFPGMEIPKYQSGTDYVPRTGFALVHQGERITPAGENGGQTIITISPQITVHAAKEVDEERLAKKIVQITKYSIRYGELGEVIKRRSRG